MHPAGMAKQTRHSLTVRHRGVYNLGSIVICRIAVSRLPRDPVGIRSE